MRIVANIKATVQASVDGGTLCRWFYCENVADAGLLAYVLHETNNFHHIIVCDENENVVMRLEHAD